MTTKHLFVGLDSFPGFMLEAIRTSDSHPTLAALMKRGHYLKHRNTQLFRTENSWLTLLQGCTPEVSKQWGHSVLDPLTHRYTELPYHDLKERAPFYALGQGRKVAIFDVPLVNLADDVDGVQILGWGTESNQAAMISSPPDLIGRIIGQYGAHPVYGKIERLSDDIVTFGYRLPSTDDLDQLTALADDLVAGICRRTDILRDIIASDDWDLVFAVYAEIHTGLHLFWHLTQPHPLRERLDELAARRASSLLSRITMALDEQLGRLLADLPDDTGLALFSPYGMGTNSGDLDSYVFLPELLHRWQFGEAALADPATARAEDAASLKAKTTLSQWAVRVWATRTPHGEAVLESPAAQNRQGNALDWCPANWYMPGWPNMTAYCVPGYSEGLLKLNPRAIEMAGERLEDARDAVIALVKGLTCAVTGRPLVRDVVVFDGEAASDRAAIADLLVIWDDEVVTNQACHPQYGTIGPVPYFRTGAHTTEGFILFVNPGLELRSDQAEVPSVDVTASLYALLGRTPPDYVGGTSLFR